MPALALVSVTLFGKGSGSRDDISWIIGADPKSNDSGPYKRKAEGKFGSDRRGNTGKREMKVYVPDSPTRLKLP